MKKLAWLVLPFLALVAACAPSSSGDDDEPSEESSEDALSASGRALVGAYYAWPGEDERFISLTLTAQKVGSQNAFFATERWADGVGHRIDGTFSAGTKRLTLRTPAATPPGAPTVKPYDYLVDGSTLSLFVAGQLVVKLHKTASYCDATEDCSVQGLTASCPGTYGCRQHTCVRECDPSSVRCSDRMDPVSCQSDGRCVAVFGPQYCSPTTEEHHLPICYGNTVFQGCSD